MVSSLIGDPSHPVTKRFAEEPRGFAGVKKEKPKIAIGI